jgi:serine phosphatase RsbU (regulator of sigma subunit)
MSKRARILLGGILLMLISAYFCIYVYSITLPKKGSSDGWSASWDGKGDPLVDSVDANGPSAGVKAGDAIIAINGIKIQDDPRVLGFSDNNPPGTRYTLTIRREGELRDVEIRTVPHQGRIQFDPFYYISLLFLVTAWGVFLLKSDDKQAWLLALMLGTLTGTLGNEPNNLPSWLSLSVPVGIALGVLFLPVFLHFFLIFPEPSKLLRRWPRLETWLYLPYLLALMPMIVTLRLPGGIWIFRFHWVRYFIIVVNFLIVAYLAAGLICLLINYRAVSPIARRRLRVVMAGSATGFFNFFLVVLGGPTGFAARMPTLWSRFSTAMFITLPLVPLSFVYAIIRHKVIPVSLIIRRGARYLLVKRGSILLVLVGVCVALYFVSGAFFYYWNPGSSRAVGIIFAVLAIIIWQGAGTVHHRVIAPKIDQWFFHQAYDAQQIIAELAESLRATTSLPQLVELVATKIQSALHSANVTILLRDEATGDYPCVYSCVYSFHNRSAMKSPSDVRVSGHSDIIAHLAISGQLLDLEGDDSDVITGAFSVEAQEAIHELKSSLLMPIMGKAVMGKEGLLGVISIGPHLGDLPFSADDKRLLLSVGGPTSFTLENIQLIERTIEDARRRQELEAENEQRARELEGARQLQLSMLPKSIPQPPHLEVAVYMKPAAEVGGDYYDFHLADDGTLTVAVGDATGHGLKAGTVVTAMKSLFRTFAAEPEIAQVFTRSSRVLKEMNLRSLFMGLTMIKLNGRRLKISAAGMPPMLIFRAETGQVEEVLIKAMPLGSVNGYPYREHELSLGHGDVVVLMSDGLPERFNPVGEMFDYSRTVDALATASAFSPQGIIEHLVSAGEAWAEGRPQDDDITFVVLKVKS